MERTFKSKNHHQETFLKSNPRSFDEGFNE
jgi:hypothetical protein